MMSASNLPRQSRKERNGVSKALVTLLSLLGAFGWGQFARAGEQTLVPQEIKVDLVPIGIPPTDGGIIYDNTDTGTSSFYYAPPAGAVPVELADDVPQGGIFHINSFIFGYATTNTARHEVLVNFYGDLDANDCPTGTPVQSLDITGLPGSSDGTVAGFAINVDLVGQGLDFDWLSSFSSTGIAENFIGFTYLQSGAGPVSATGGGSQDLFWSGKDLRSPYESGCFFWNFGGPPNPEGSFYIRISGTVQ